MFVFFCLFFSDLYDLSRLSELSYTLMGMMIYCVGTFAGY